MTVPLCLVQIWTVPLDFFELAKRTNASNFVTSTLLDALDVGCH